MADVTIWFPFYIGDFLANTARFSTEEIGALLLLQADYFRNGPPPNDERILRQTTRLTPPAWGNAWLVLQECFAPADDGRLHNPAWDREVAEIHEKRLASSIRAENAAKARWTKHALSNASGNSQAELGSCQSQLQSQSDAEITTTNANAPTLTPGASLVGNSLVFIELPLRDGTGYPITEKDISEWGALYPNTDVRQDCRSMKGWFIGNPEKCKTRSGILRFITSWLKRSQGQAKPIGGNSGNQRSKTDGNLSAAEETLARRQRRRDSSAVDRSSAG